MRKPKTDQELLREAEALDTAYATAAEFDAQHAQEPPHEGDEEESACHAVDELRRAALNHRGLP